jgi:hypothetical protein
MSATMGQSRQQVYVQGDFSEPMNAQHNFVNNFNLDDPESAMSAYQKIMHEHTKRQLSTATDSARRRSGSVNFTLGFQQHSSSIVCDVSAFSEYSRYRSGIDSSTSSSSSSPSSSSPRHLRGKAFGFQTLYDY